MKWCIRIFLSIFSSIVFSVIFSMPLLAASDVMNTTTSNTITQNTNDTASIESHAHDWGLTVSEWKRYSTLIQGKSRKEYTKLTPPEVLGIYATSPEELAHFAEISAKQEHEKLERELRFNAAFYLAAKRLYADELLIKPFDLTPYTPIPAKS